MLGKTEIGNEEIQIEEDHWVAGVEWAERNGADIVSSSLGYIDWYTWEDMDGETAVTTRHADMAVQRGVLVVNSAGNEGRYQAPNTLIAPADGKFVLAIGAVDLNNSRVAFSSYGPTFDGRIKPDLAALGTGVRIASPSSATAFSSASGTSFSCPLVAGVAALLLSADPGLDPFQLTRALRSTASQAGSPDNLLGWGIVNAGAALDYITGAEPADDFGLQQNYPNPFNDFTVIGYRLPTPSDVRLELYDIRGRRIR
jgi:subtilisin family serine protease